MEVLNICRRPAPTRDFSLASFALRSSAAAAVAAVVTVASPALYLSLCETPIDETVTCALANKSQPNGGGPITIGVSNEESSGGAHLGSGIPARTSNRAQYGGVRPGDCVVICFLAKVLQSRPTKNED